MRDPFTPQILATQSQLVRHEINKHKFYNPEMHSFNPQQQQEQLQPMESLVVDPVLKQARAEEAFYAQQLESGYQVYKSGMIDTAADEQNLRAYEESGMKMDSGPEQQDATPPPMMDPNSMPPPVYDPFNPMMFLGGY